MLERRRLRRKVGRLRSRDRCCRLGAEVGATRQDRPHARGGFLLPSRPASRSHADAHRLRSARKDGRSAPAHRPRRRRLRQLRRRQHLLHGRSSDPHIPTASISLRRSAGLHQQAALRSQARSRHSAAALRSRSAARRGGVRARPRSGRHPPRQPHRGALGDGELVEDRFQRAAPLYRGGARR